MVIHSFRAAALTCLVLASSGLADVIYTQNFDTPDTLTGNGDALGIYSWAAHNGSTGKNSALHADADNNWDNPVTSAGTQARVVHDAGAPSGTDRIFAFWGLANSGGQDVLFWTESFSPIDRNAYQDLAVSWYQFDSTGSNGTTRQRAAVAIDTGAGVQWYAGDLKTNTATPWLNQTAELDAAIWVPFTFNGTQSGNATAGFDVAGAAGSLPAGNLVAAGLYVELAFQTAGRFDSFEIVGVIPEPSSLMLAAIGLGCIGQRRRGDCA